jgi:hypothetical protein
LNRFRFLHVLVTLLLALTLLPVQPARAGGGTVFVDADSACVSSCGGSWATAYPTLQTALAGPSAIYWVAEGVYYPDEGTGQVNNSRTSNFSLTNGVEIYGGFNGTETLLSQRNVSANPTILSGDIDKNDVNTDGDFIADTTADIMGDNAYHVVTGGSGIDNTTILDGFTITAGKANGSYPHNHGGGINNSLSSPTLRYLTFSGNYAINGGGMNNYSSHPTLSNILFSGNAADANGGGMSSEKSSSTLIGVSFTANEASRGGGIYNGNLSDGSLTNVTFSGNKGEWGGGIDNSFSAPTLNKVTFQNNEALNLGGGINNDRGNPILTNVTFSGNSAGNGGGFSNVNEGAPLLKNVTFSANSASNMGGGLYNSRGAPTLINTLIANSVDGGDCFNIIGSSLNIASTHNLIEDSANACDLTNGWDGNIIGSDPKLGALDFNMGATKSHALLANSPAIDAGDTASCPTADQRDAPRPQGPKCDIGSYEVEQVSKVFRSTGANDGWVLESGENTSKGGSKDNEATVFRLGDGEADKQYRAILSFNTDSLPDGAIITRVIVKIKEQGISGTNPFAILGGLKVDMQKPFFGATLGLTIADFEAAAGKNAVATFGANATASWYSAVLNAAGKGFINKTGVTQFRLRFATTDNDDNAADYMKFFSGNHSVAANRPTLIIKYYVP